MKDILFILLIVFFLGYIGYKESQENEGKSIIHYAGEEWKKIKIDFDKGYKEINCDTLISVCGDTVIVAN